MNKNVKIIITFIIFITLINIVFFFLSYGNPFEKKIFKDQVEQYLKEKYIEEMVVTNVEYSFKTYQYSAKVNLVQNPQIKFKVDKLKEANFEDNYISAVWSYQVGKDISDFANNIINVNNCEGSIMFTENMDFYQEYKAQNQVPEFLSVRNKITTGIYSFVKIPYDFQKNEQIYCRKMYEIMKYIFDRYQFKEIRFDFINNIYFIIRFDEYELITDANELLKYRQ